ncbi:MAG: DUF5011 domain-containing protein [Ruminococcus sp.]|nr:DUF5011 domain-containing protein [Ruminococcus sp.]
MKKKVFLSLLFILLAILSILCAFIFLSHNKTLTENEPTVTESPTGQSETVDLTDISTSSFMPSTETKNDITIANGSLFVISLTQTEQQTLVGFECSDESVITVDDGGRIDALQEGTAEITATFSNLNSYKYKVNVTKKEDSIEYDGFSTCILANTDILAENIRTFTGARSLYSIKVNRQMNCVTVYTYDSNGKYTIPVRAMVCSCGLNKGTILGEFKIYFQNEWNGLLNNVYGHYVSGISGNYLFHSVPYYSTNENKLETEEYNKLGSDGSLGCVRLAVADSKWVYENCPVGTPVTIYDDSNPGPLGKPESIHITDLQNGWDPTDDNKNNPYLNKKPTINGVSDTTINVGDDFDILKGVSALDTCGNDITDKMVVTGNVISSKAGTYKVTYEVEDAMHRTAKTDIVVTVLS